MMTIIKPCKIYKSINKGNPIFEMYIRIGSVKKYIVKANLSNEQENIILKKTIKEGNMTSISNFENKDFNTPILLSKYTDFLSLEYTDIDIDFTIIFS